MSAVLLAVTTAAVQDLDRETLVEVKPGPRRYFQDGSRRGCPGPGAACRTRAYVVPGDRLAASNATGGYSLVTYVAKGGRTQTTGWIETVALRTVALAPPAARDWLGEWRAWDDDIEIKPSATPGLFRIEGGAVWGANDPQRVENGGVHVADFSVVLKLSGDRIAFASIWSADDANDHAALPYDTPREDVCRVRLRLLGPYLLAQDNEACGGAFVTFNGVYRR